MAFVSRLVGLSFVFICLVFGQIYQARAQEGQSLANKTANPAVNARERTIADPPYLDLSYGDPGRRSGAAPGRSDAGSYRFVKGVSRGPLLYTLPRADAIQPPIGSLDGRARRLSVGTGTVIDPGRYRS